MPCKVKNLLVLVMCIEKRKVITRMPEVPVVLEIDGPHYVVRLYENMLRIDLHGSVKDDIEEALENKPVLRQTLGHILGLFAPLHIRLSDIDAVRMDEKGNVKIVLPRHRDIVIPLETQNAKRLVDKLNQLIPEEKEKELERIKNEQKLQRTAEEEAEPERTAEEHKAWTYKNV